MKSIRIQLQWTKITSSDQGRNLRGEGGVIGVITPTSGGQLFFRLLRLNFAIEKSKFTKFTKIKILNCAAYRLHSRIFSFTLVNFDKKSTTIFIFFVKKTKTFARTEGARKYISSERVKSG